jgi:hypothetical protein
MGETATRLGKVTDPRVNGSKRFGTMGSCGEVRGATADAV